MVALQLMMSEHAVGWQLTSERLEQRLTFDLSRYEPKTFREPPRWWLAASGQRTVPPMVTKLTKSTTVVVPVQLLTIN